MKKDLLYLIVMIMPIPNDDLIQENILIQLLEHKDPIILDYIIPKLPPDIVSKVIFVNTSIDKVLQGTIINYFLSANKTIEALDIALKVKSIQTFKILSEYSDTFQLFLQNPSYFSDLFDIDVNKANEVCKRYRELIDYEKLLENVNGAKIMSFINDLLVENPNPKLENAMFDLLLTHQPDSLSIFIESCKNLDLNQALSKCAAKKALDGQIVILKKLKRNEEIIEILMNNFSLRLKYIHHYPEL